MPSIADAVEVMSRLESKIVHVELSRCLMVRNRNAHCTKCADACPHNCISAENNMLDIDKTACVNCGVCSTACPTEALVPIDPPDTDLFERTNAALAVLAEADDGYVPDQFAIVCARKAAQGRAAANRILEVPCICRVHESLLIELARVGVREILLVDGHCKTCIYRDSASFADTVVESANALLEAWGESARAIRTEELPESAVATIAGESGSGLSRRQFFTEIGSNAKVAAVETANVTFAVEEIASRPARNIRDILKPGDNGCLISEITPRRATITAALDHMGEPEEVEYAETRLWGTVSIDEELCSNCGVCAVFCPSGALRKYKEGKERWQEWAACDCVGCSLCADACQANAITVLPGAYTDAMLSPDVIVYQGTKSLIRGLNGKPVKK